MTRNQPVFSVAATRGRAAARVLWAVWRTEIDATSTFSPCDLVEPLASGEAGSHAEGALAALAVCPTAREVTPEYASSLPWARRHAPPEAMRTAWRMEILSQLVHELHAERDALLSTLATSDLDRLQASVDRLRTRRRHGGSPAPLAKVVREARRAPRVRMGAS